MQLLEGAESMALFSEPPDWNMKVIRVEEMEHDVLFTFCRLTMDPADDGSIDLCPNEIRDGFHSENAEVTQPSEKATRRRSLFFFRSFYVMAEFRFGTTLILHFAVFAPIHRRRSRSDYIMAAVGMQIARARLFD